MEITKKQWTIIGVIVAVIAVWYFFLRKKTESGFSKGTPGGTKKEHPTRDMKPPCPTGEEPCKTAEYAGLCCKATT